VITSEHVHRNACGLAITNCLFTFRTRWVVDSHHADEVQALLHSFTLVEVRAHWQELVGDTQYTKTVSSHVLCHLVDLGLFSLGDIQNRQHELCGALGVDI
jgi:hypothetical protein